jgi:hypothetical protein
MKPITTSQAKGGRNMRTGKTGRAKIQRGKGAYGNTAQGTTGSREH